MILESTPLPSIFLVGPMGAGKTTVGRLLANRLARQFIDSDHYIEQQTGADIPWIFAKEGESGFREREKKAIAELTEQPQIILATGGGVVTQESNCQLLNQRGLVIYLNATVDVQLARTMRDKSRPLLQQDNPKDVLSRLYAVRHPIYQSVAHIEVSTGHTYPKNMVNEIIEMIKNLGYTL